MYKTLKRSVPKKTKISSYSEDTKNVVQNISDWVRAAIEREENGERVFTSKIIVDEIQNISRISKSSIYRFLKDGEVNVKPKKMCKEKVVFDEFDEKGLSRIILGFYKRTPPELPTLDKIYKEALNLQGFPRASRSTVYRLIKKLGFVFKKRNKKMCIYQRLDIVLQRHNFLRKINEYRKNEYHIYYQDETWCNTNHTKECVWQLENTSSEELLMGTEWKGGLNVPSGAGRRLIINDIGSREGFLKGCGEVFVGTKSGDYHSEMNSLHFEDWWKTKVLPSLPDKSVVIVDNAKYHSRMTDNSKKPTTSWRKQEIVDFLQSKQKEYPPKATKATLLEICKDIFVPKKYVLESVTDEFCQLNKREIRILRLPIGHSELNAIELIWAQSKNEVASKNIKFNLTATKELMSTALSNVTQENWRKAIDHVKQVEDAFRKNDFGEHDHVNNIDKVIISLNSDSESDSDSNESYFTDEEDI